MQCGWSVYVLARWCVSTVCEQCEPKTSLSLFERFCLFAVVLCNAVTCHGCLVFMSCISLIWCETTETTLTYMSTHARTHRLCAFAAAGAGALQGGTGRRFLFGRTECQWHVCLSFPFFSFPLLCFLVWFECAVAFYVLLFDAHTHTRRYVYRQQMQWVFSAMNASNGVNSECVSAHTASGDAWMCMFAPYTLPFINSALFPVQAQYDTYAFACFALCCVFVFCFVLFAM